MKVVDLCLLFCGIVTDAMQQRQPSESSFSGYDKAIAEALRMGLVLPEELTEIEQEKFLQVRPVTAQPRKRSRVAEERAV